MSEIKQKIRDMIKEEIKNFKSTKPTKKVVKETTKKKVTETKKTIKEDTSEKIDGIIVVTTSKGTIELHLPQGMKGVELKKWLAKHPEIDQQWSKK